ncbi:hypothetical protein EDC94DRAFT_588584 [Helicostylum pulchrum]|nr:hypothetical protein EDC94DRAFT_588584 [Helicostylum pulchrum]
MISSFEASPLIWLSIVGMNLQVGLRTTCRFMSTILKWFDVVKRNSPMPSYRRQGGNGRHVRKRRREGPTLVMIPTLTSCRRDFIPFQTFRSRLEMDTIPLFFYCVLLKALLFFLFEPFSTTTTTTKDCPLATLGFIGRPKLGWTLGNQNGLELEVFKELPRFLHEFLTSSPFTCEKNILPHSASRNSPSHRSPSRSSPSRRSSSRLAPNSVILTLGM